MNPGTRFQSAEAGGERKGSAGGRSGISLGSAGLSPLGGARLSVAGTLGAREQLGQVDYSTQRLPVLPHISGDLRRRRKTFGYG